MASLDLDQVLQNDTPIPDPSCDGTVKFSNFHGFIFSKLLQKQSDQGLRCLSGLFSAGRQLVFEILECLTYILLVAGTLSLRVWDIYMTENLSLPIPS